MPSLARFVLFLLLISPFHLFSQQKDLEYYLEKAKENSVFLHKNKNEKKLIALDLEQITNIYKRPEVTLEGGLLLAPIIAHENDKNQLKVITKDVSNYTGYDLAATDGGQYQAVVSVKKSMFNKENLAAYTKKAEIQDKINDNNTELTLHELENVVKHQYILCLKAKKFAESSLGILKEVESEELILQELVKNAIYNESDLMLLQIAKTELPPGT